MKLYNAYQDMVEDIGDQDGGYVWEYLKDTFNELFCENENLKDQVKYLESKVIPLSFVGEQRQTIQFLHDKIEKLTNDNRKLLFYIQESLEKNPLQNIQPYWGNGK
jgi:uncharacterized protein YydD (DUF2326 family)